MYIGDSKVYNTVTGHVLDLEACAQKGIAMAKWDHV
jgi:hypothetical protein